MHIYNHADVLICFTCSLLLMFSSNDVNINFLLQPLCDGTHKSPYLKIKFKPIKFKVEKDGDYWLCQCKQTSHRPFCDGTHKREDIQAIKK